MWRHLQLMCAYAVCPTYMLSLPQFLFATAGPFICTTSPTLRGPVAPLYSHNYAIHAAVRAITRLHWDNLLTNICPMNIVRSGIVFNHPCILWHIVCLFRCSVKFCPMKLWTDGSLAKSPTHVRRVKPLA